MTFFGIEVDQPGYNLSYMVMASHYYNDNNLFY
jgi:hypothetical protein